MATTVPCPECGEPFTPYDPDSERAHARCHLIGALEMGREPDDYDPADFDGPDERY